MTLFSVSLFCFRGDVCRFTGRPYVGHVCRTSPYGVCKPTIKCLLWASHSRPVSQCIQSEAGKARIGPCWFDWASPEYPNWVPGLRSDSAPGSVPQATPGAPQGQRCKSPLPTDYRKSHTDKVFRLNL